MDVRIARASCGGLTVLTPDDMRDGDAPNLRVTKAEEESSIWLVEEKACDILLANKADDQPGQSEGGDTAVDTGCREGAAGTGAWPPEAMDSPV